MQPARIHPFRAIYFIIFVHFCHVNTNTNCDDNRRFQRVLQIFLCETFELKKCKKFVIKDGKFEYFTVKNCIRDKCKW